ncbi:hypothetical protein Porky_28 [Mycobacterium phage Porky]|uniref:Minor tail protein n=1 Tax=Mycobacterium phage Porky TaxID=2914015 RepID=B5A5Z0_9CAUD|nr:minor tail protein [Mycobacterium phage Porky]YP_008857515.1 minor tail protein [Mycobacterium phage PhatBacter]ATN89124.1 minor tail protein [Mycobacterium phage FireRed]AXH48664.1 minor tail protein [Mycobacterium phage ShereKhan]QGJ92292.1 hypothetical protein SEA_ORIONPAX_29 [Mycobacterium phage OrionPax]WNO26112.1 hypothetical protein SEA_SAINTS25_29 [Mycobacterium phage Saints25]WNO28474.1 hypothetical protein SEA_HIGHBURY_29 [Mycobacterium phage Highbury]
MAAGWWVEKVVKPQPKQLTLTMGTPIVTQTNDVLVTPAPMHFDLDWGTPVNGLAVTPAPAEMELAWGTPVVTQGININPPGAGLTLTPGTPAVISTANQFIKPAGKDLAFSWGVPVVTTKPKPAFGSISSLVGGTIGPTVGLNAPAGADVFALVAWDRSVTGVTGITYDGVAMEFVAQLNHNNTPANGSLVIYRLAGAGTGSTKTFSVSSSGSSWYILGGISYTNVGAIGTPVTAYGVGDTASQALTIPSNGVALQVVSSGRGSASVGEYTSFSGVTNHAHNRINGAVTMAINTVSASGVATSTATSTTNPWAAITIPLT